MAFAQKKPDEQAKTAEESLEDGVCRQVTLPNYRPFVLDFASEVATERRLLSQHASEFNESLAAEFEKYLKQFSVGTMDQDFINNAYGDEWRMGPSIDGILEDQGMSMNGLKGLLRDFYSFWQQSELSGDALVGAFLSSKGIESDDMKWIMDNFRGFITTPGSQEDIITFLKTKGEDGMTPAERVVSQSGLDLGLFLLLGQPGGAYHDPPGLTFTFDISDLVVRNYLIEIGGGLNDLYQWGIVPTESGTTGQLDSPPYAIPGNSNVISASASAGIAKVSRIFNESVGYEGDASSRVFSAQVESERRVPLTLDLEGNAHWSPGVYIGERTGT
jgi:hypothetical protein